MPIDYCMNLLKNKARLSPGFVLYTQFTQSLQFLYKQGPDGVQNSENHDPHIRKDRQEDDDEDPRDGHHRRGALDHPFPGGEELPLSPGKKGELFSRFIDGRLVSK